VDDQDVIQEQIDRHAGVSMTYRFAPGTYHFHHFRGDKANTRACVRVASQEQHLVRFEAAGFPMRGRDYNAGFALTGSAVFRVEDSAFDNLNGSERVFVLTGLQDSGAPDAQYPNNEAYPGRSIQASGIGVDLPDNMHAVTCFDGYAFSSMRFTRLTAANRQSQLTMDTTGAGSNIAFRSVGTGKYPADIIMDGCIAFGHHLGFQVGGEHLIMRQCASLFCNLGYDLYPYILHGAHPFTMMQCCAEKCKRTIFFEQNQQTSGDGVSPGTRQSINGSIIDWNEESQVGTDARWARTSGAQESWPGTFRGQVTYSIANEAHYMLNDMRIPFWNPPDSIGIHGTNSRTLKHGRIPAGIHPLRRDEHRRGRRPELLPRQRLRPEHGIPDHEPVPAAGQPEIHRRPVLARQPHLPLGRCAEEVLRPGRPGARHTRSAAILGKDTTIRIYNMLDAGDNLQITTAGRIIDSMEGDWR
jgi:hypothetical protein